MGRLAIAEVPLAIAEVSTREAYERCGQQPVCPRTAQCSALGATP